MCPLPSRLDKKCGEWDTLFLNPLCKSNIINKDSTLNLGQMVECLKKIVEKIILLLNE